MNLNLIVHNIGFISSALATMVAVIFLLFNNIRSKGHIPLVLTLLAVEVFIISHVWGVNAINSEISRSILMFNLSIFFIGMFNVHAVLCALDKDKEKRYILTFIYALGIVLVLWFLKYPYFFLEPSVSKMYFSNYYEPGIFNWIRIAYLYGFCLSYMVYELIMSYRREENVLRKRQLKYLTLAYILAYVSGYIPNFLIYDIEIDPLWGMMFMVFFAMLFLYGAIKYGLMNIKVIAKQASVYGLILGSIGGAIVLLQYLSHIIEFNYPDFPVWVVPLLSIFIVYIVTIIVWKKIRQVDLLKYEFITTVTHKFRTPLTEIKWSIDNLNSKSNLSSDDRDQLGRMQSANSKLVELTNLLVNISEADTTVYKYNFERINLNKLIDETLLFFGIMINSKKITINKNYDENLYVKCDESKIKFIIQTFIKNAINYSISGGQIDISLRQKNNKVFLSVKDYGIGIEKRELPLLFSKFYRSNQARLKDTEGFGIDLFISKEIITRHNGKIWVESDGLNTGSTFSFSLLDSK